MIRSLWLSFMELSFIVSLDGIDKRDINAGKPKRFKNRIAYVGAIVMGMRRYSGLFV